MKVWFKFDHELYADFFEALVNAGFFGDGRIASRSPFDTSSVDVDFGAYTLDDEVVMGLPYLQACGIFDSSRIVPVKVTGSTPIRPPPINVRRGKLLQIGNVRKARRVRRK